MDADQLPTLDAATRAAFARDGWVVVPGLIHGPLLTQVQAGYRHAVAGGLQVAEWRERWKPGALLQLPAPSRHIPGLQDRQHLERIVAVARQLLGPAIGFWYDQLIYKPAGNPWETPWHQDAGYWRGLGEDFVAVTAWLAVEDVDADMGCMQFVSGSHRTGILDHRSVAECNPISGALEAEADTGTAVTVPLRAGDVSFHHARTLHYTAGNTGRRDRMGLVNHLADLDHLARMGRSPG